MAALWGSVVSYTYRLDHETEQQLSFCTKTMQLSLPAKMALPGWVSLAFPVAGAAAAKHRGLWNGLTKPGCPNMTAFSEQTLLFFLLTIPVPVVELRGRKTQAAFRPGSVHSRHSWSRSSTSAVSDHWTLLVDVNYPVLLTVITTVHTRTGW